MSKYARFNRPYRKGGAMAAIQKNHRDAKAAYSAATPSRFRRERKRVGGTADAHANHLEFWRIRELARDMDRNDSVVGQLVDRACDNIVGSGFKPVPQTGDEGLNKEILGRLEGWGGDRFNCCAAEKFTFADMQWLFARHMLVDGDVFGLPIDDGTIQLVEGDHVTSPFDQRDSVVHGIELDSRDRARRYWFLKPRPEHRKINTRLHSSNKDDYLIIPAKDTDGMPLVFHGVRYKRVSQTRGISGLAPVADIAGQFEDIQFAKLLQQQVMSCIALFIERTTGMQIGPNQTEEVTGSNTEYLEEMQPGLIVRAQSGETVKGFSPSVNAAEWSEQARMLLRILGANLGMPLTLVLLDTTNTTFHGYRGELDQARIGFSRLQGIVEHCFNRRVYKHKLQEWFPELWANERTRRALCRHRWAKPGWKYVDPLKDAQADAFQLENLLISPRDLSSSRGHEWSEIVSETVEDRALAIEAAAIKAKELSDAYGLSVTWRDLLNLKTPAGMTITESRDANEQKEGGDGQ